MRKTTYLLTGLILIQLLCVSLSAQTTQFTYQGSLKDGANAASGNYDFEFVLFDALSGGTQVGSTLTKSSVAVANGIFSVSLDFGPSYPGAARFLEIHVRPAGVGLFTTLAPRQPVNSSPYSVKTLSADTAANATNATNATNAINANNATTAATATNATQLGGVAANQYVLTGDARLSDARPPTAGSSNYIQNGTTQQAASNFYISGNGIAGGILSADALALNPGGTVMFARRPSNNPSNPPSNLFVGVIAGTPSLTGEENSVFGYNSGPSITSGGSNSFFGSRTGQMNSTGANNSFFGGASGNANTTGSNNSFFGMQAGVGNSTGANNTLIGNLAGSSNQTGSNNTIIGSGSNVSSNNLSNATAIGANASVSQSNSLVLGSINGVNGASADTNVGIGTTAPTTRLHVVGNGLFTGNLTTTGNFGIGAASPGPKLYVGSGFDGQSGPVEAIRIQGPNAPANSNSAQDLTWSFASAGSSAIRSYRGQIWDTYLQFITTPLDSNTPTVRMHISENGYVGIGTTNPQAKLQVQDFSGVALFGTSNTGYGLYAASNTNYAGYFSGNVYVAGSVTQASDARLKKNITKLSYGLSEVMRLHPVSWLWKERPDRGTQIGLVAQEVEPVLPELVSTSKDVEQIKSINYTGLLPIVIKAIQEQQAQIEAQTKTIEQLKRQAAEVVKLKKLVCSTRRRAAACR